MPKTQALQNAKIDGLEALDAWMFDSLSRGTFKRDLASESEESQCEARISKNALIDVLMAWERDNKRAVRGNKSMRVGRIMTKIGGKTFEKRGSTERYWFEIPDIETLRANFEAHIGFKIEW